MASISDILKQTALEMSGGSSGNTKSSGSSGTGVVYPFSLFSGGSTSGSDPNNNDETNSTIYGFGGYGFGSSGPSQAQKDTAAKLAPITVYGQDTILGKANNMSDVYGIADIATNNFAEGQSKGAEKAAGVEWFSRLLKEQSAYDQLRNEMGNARYGSGALDLNQKVERAHDANAVSVLENMEQQQFDIDLDRLNALQSNVNAWNETAANTEASLRNNLGDYAAQMNNILGGDSDELDGLIDTDALKLNLPDWAEETYYSDNKKGPLSLDYVSNLTRPAAATEQTMPLPRQASSRSRSDRSLFDQWDRGLQSLGTHNGSAANKRYWDTLTNDYGHRVV